MYLRFVMYIIVATAKSDSATDGTIEDERGLTMNRTCVAIYLPTDEKENYHGKPLILQNVMFCPVLTWCTRAWAARGVQRFFLVGECSEAILSCFPEGADIRRGTEADWRAHAKELMDEGWRIEESKEPVMPLGNLMISFHSMTELNQLQVACHDSVITQLQSRGVRVMDPNTAYIDPRVEVGEGTIILPNTILRGETVIGRDCEIGPNAVITSCVIGDNVQVNSSQVTESELKEGVMVGPYAHIRPGCVVEKNCKIGAFTQLKNSHLGEGTKLPHLSYIGDADVGDHVNFGCGSVTCNYDGFKKSRTVIGSGVFVGCHTSLVPPVEVHDGAYIAAGTTVTRDVPADALAISRVRQENKDGWAKRNREMKEK